MLACADCVNFVFCIVSVHLVCASYWVAAPSTIPHRQSNTEISFHPSSIVGLPSLTNTLPVCMLYPSFDASVSWLTCWLTSTETTRCLTVNMLEQQHQTAKFESLLCHRMAGYCQPVHTSQLVFNPCGSFLSPLVHRPQPPSFLPARVRHIAASMFNSMLYASQLHRSEQLVCDSISTQLHCLSVSLGG